MRVVRGPLGRGREERRVQGAGQPIVGAVASPVVVLIPVFDLDGTLLDSDEALADPFVALGVARADVTFGHVVADECRRLGLALSSYLALYDVTSAQPFDGVDEMVRGLGTWAVCSNKVRAFGVAELDRLGWAPTVALFAEDFGGTSKRLAPVLEALDALGLGGDGGGVVFVGDTAHDRACAAEAGATFALAAWNPRAASVALDGDLVLRSPSDLVALLDR